MNLRLPDADIRYYSNFYSGEKAGALFDSLLAETPWQQDNVRVFGKIHPQPRLTAFYGDPGKIISYSGVSMAAHPWTELLSEIRDDVGEIAASAFNSVLLNLYRDGRDSNGWHADNESYLGRNPVIASLTLGQPRAFQLKHNSGAHPAVKMELEHGSLLIMAGTTQHYWKHQVPKTAKVVSPRINLTFRHIY